MADIATIGFRADTKGLKGAERGLGRVQRAGAGVDKQMNTVRNSVRLLAGALAAMGATQLFGSIIRATAQFETALVGVSKTTGLVGRDLDMLAGRIDRLSQEIPVSTNELLGMAQAAGQMGVTGADNLEKFSKTVAMLGRASDLAGDQAATALARILNVTGENISEVDVLASVIVSLGNNVAATESEIAHMTTRVARATSAFGVSSSEAAALSAALASVGIEAEAGGTAVGQAFSGITNAVNAGGEELEKFAGALGLNAQLLAETFQSNKIAGFEMFLGRLAELGDGAGLALEAAGLGGIRLAQSLIPLGRNIGIYEETQRLANAETQNATALTREFEAAIDTLDSQWQMTTNIASSFAREIGGSLLPALSSALSGFNEWAREGDNIADTVDALSTVAGALAFIVGTRLTVALGKSAAGFASQTVAGLAATKTVNAYGQVVSQTTVRQNLLNASVRAGRGAMALVGGPAGVALIAAAAIYHFATRTSEAEKALGGFNNTLDDTISRFEELGAAGRRVSLAALEDEISNVEGKIAAARASLEEFQKQTEAGGTAVSLGALLFGEDERLAKIENLNTELEKLREKQQALTGVQGDLAQSTANYNDRLARTLFGVSDGALGFQEFAVGAGVLKAEMQDVPVMLEGVARAASSAGKEVEKMSKDQIEALKNTAKEYQLLAKLVGVTTAREEELIRMQAEGIDITSDLAVAVLDAADAYDKLANKAESSLSPVQAVMAEIEAAQNDPFGFKAGEDPFDSDTWIDNAGKVENAWSSAFGTIEGAIGGAVNELSKVQGAMEDGSKGAKQLENVMTALSVAQGVAAIANAMASGDPYTAVARAIAVAATLAAAGIETGVTGGSSTVAADAQESQGTGGVLGDAEAKSESILKSTEIAAEATSELVGINRAQLHALQAMGRAITGVTEGLVRSGGIDSITSGMQFGGDAILGSDFLTATHLPSALNEVARQFNADLGLGMLGDFNPSIVVGNLMDGLWQELNDEFFRTDTDLVDSGIQLFGGAFGDIISGALSVAQGFADVETETKIFGIGLGSEAETLLQNLDAETSGQILNVLTNMGDAVRAGASALGIAESDIEQRLNSFELTMRQISLKDLSPEEQQAELEAVFSSIFDELAGAVVPFLDDFAKVGEGTAETLVRIATNIQVFEAAIERLGFAAERTSAEQFAHMATDLIEMAGGMEEFITSMTGFFDKFASDSVKFDQAQGDLTAGLDQVGLALPETSEGFFDLMQSLDASTASGQQQIATLLRLQDAAAEYYSQVDRLERQRQDLEIQLLQLQGRGAEALAMQRRLELESMDESLRPLQEQIWALQDLEAAADATAQSTQALADFQRGVADQLLGILSPAHAELNRLNQAQAAQIEQSSRLVDSEEDLVNMRRLHQLQLMEFAAGLEESISSLSDQLFGNTETAMDKTVRSVDDGMNRVRDLMISGIAQVNDWLQSSMLSSVSPLTPEARLGEAESQFFDQIAAAQGGDASAISGLSGMADQLLSEASGFFGGSTQEFDDIWMRVREAMQGIAGMDIPDAQKDPQQAIRTATESTAMSALEQITLASDMVGQIAALSRVTEENPSDIADRLDVPMGRLLDIMGMTPEMTAGALDGQFDGLVNGFDMTVDPLLTAQHTQIDVTRKMNEDINLRLERLEEIMTQGVVHQQRTANNTGEQTANTQQLVAVQRRNNQTRQAPRIGA